MDFFASGRMRKVKPKVKPVDDVSTLPFPFTPPSA
jgi:hypothetical protein